MTATAHSRKRYSKLLGFRVRGQEDTSSPHVLQWGVYCRQREVTSDYCTAVVSGLSGLAQGNPPVYVVRKTAEIRESPTGPSWTFFICFSATDREFVEFWCGLLIGCQQQHFGCAAASTSDRQYEEYYGSSSLQYLAVWGRWHVRDLAQQL